MRYAQLIQSNFEVVGTSGSEFVCRCPWHKDGDKPNLYINGDKGVYICHSCGQKGHLKYLGQNLPPQKVKDIRDRIKALNTPPPLPVYYPEGWLKQFKFDHPAWAQRGLSPEIVQKFNLGFDPFRNELIIPLRDARGRVLGVIRRRTDDQKPKYTYPKGFKIGRHLFGAWMVRKRHQRVAIVEGSVDAIACWDARVPAVGLLGSRITTDQVKVLQRLGVKHIVLMLDNDRAGLDGMFQVHEALQGTGILVSVGWYRSYWTDTDPAALKPDRRRKMFHSAVPWRQWIDQGGFGV